MDVAANANGGYDDDDDQDHGNEMDTSMASTMSPTTTTTAQFEDDNIIQQEDVMELVESARLILTSSGGDNNHSDNNEDDYENGFSIAIAEMCRLAQRSVSENLDQSLASHLGTGKRKSYVMFGGDHQLSARDSSTNGVGKKRNNHDEEDQEDEVSLRFKLAASRIFALYAQQKGSETAEFLFSEMYKLSEETIAFDGPRKHVWQALAIVKQVALEFAEIFDESSRAGPVPEMDDHGAYMGGFSSSSGMGVLSGMKSSLQIDVERIFKEKLFIFLHPSVQLDFSRNALIFLVLKVAFRGWLEAIRVCSFSADGFKQLQMDVEFLKHMIPHYIDENFTVETNDATTSLRNLLSDVMEAAGERCLDDSCESDEDLMHSSRSILRSFIDRIIQEDNEIGSHFIIQEDEQQEEGNP